MNAPGNIDVRGGEEVLRPLNDEQRFAYSIKTKA